MRDKITTAAHREAVLLAIGSTWARYPESRLGQLITNAAWTARQHGEGYYARDADLVAGLRMLAKRRPAPIAAEAREKRRRKP